MPMGLDRRCVGRGLLESVGVLLGVEVLVGTDGRRVLKQKHNTGYITCDLACNFAICNFPELDLNQL